MSGYKRKESINHKQTYKVLIYKTHTQTRLLVFESGLKLFLIILKLAPLVCTINSHTDVISAIDFFNKNDSIYVLIASYDCSVSINDMNGKQIGIFGQDSNWKLEQSIPIRYTKESMSILRSSTRSAKSNKSNVGFKTDIDEINKKTTSINESKEKKDATNINTTTTNNNEIINNNTTYLNYIGTPPQLFTALNKNLNIEPTFEYDEDAFINDTSLRYNPWSKTILGS